MMNLIPDWVFNLTWFHAIAAFHVTWALYWLFWKIGLTVTIGEAVWLFTTERKQHRQAKTLATELYTYITRSNDYYDGQWRLTFKSYEFSGRFEKGIPGNGRMICVSFSGGGDVHLSEANDTNIFDHSAKYLIWRACRDIYYYERDYAANELRRERAFAKMMVKKP